MADFSSAHSLCTVGGKYIVALSGGADSVALLYVLRRCADDMKLVVEAAHCNFHLRGEESDRDESFCRDLCTRLDVPLHLVHFDTREYAASHHVSIEMAARDLRYSYFERLRVDIGADGVCVAHHRADCVETILLNLVRGTGLKGLRGIQPVNGHIIRPLLCVGRCDIVAYLDAVGQPYVTDSSNLQADVKRNKLRLEVIPQLEQMNPSFQLSVMEMATHIGEAMKMVQAAVAQAVSYVCTADADGRALIDVGRLREQPSAEYVLHEILSRYGFTSAQTAQVERLLASCPTGHVFTSATHELLFDRGRILVERKPSAAEINRMLRIPECGIYIYGENHRLRVEEEACGPGYAPSRASDVVCLDASKLVFPLTLRHLVKGDAFVPFGMVGKKLVSDYLTDRKKTLFDKRRQMVLADGSGRVAWLVGERVDNRFRVDAGTEKVVKITAEN